MMQTPHPENLKTPGERHAMILAHEKSGMKIRGIRDNKMKNKNLKNLILISILLLISGCLDNTGNLNNSNSDNTNADRNITKFGKSIEIIFTNETFDGIWNEKVMTGRKGEQAMDWYAKQRNWTRIDEEKSPHSPGIDGICRKNDGSYIFIEAKETSQKSDYNSPLSTGASYGAQMSDQWIEYHIIKINDSEMLASFYDENYKKLVVIYKINDYEGSTITKKFAGSLSNVGVDNVVIIKKFYYDGNAS